MAASHEGGAAAGPLAGRTAIVTGASRGIGRAISLQLASLGADLVLNYSSSSFQADQLAAEINASSPTPRAVAVRADVSVASDVKSLFDRAEEAFGGRTARIVVNNAGLLETKYPSVADTTEEDWDRLFATNTKGAFLCSREAARRMSVGGGGRIINLSSSLVGTLLPGYGAYVASKAAVEAMTKVLAKEVGRNGVTANCVAPGPVATEMFMEGKTEEQVAGLGGKTPGGRLGETRDIAPVVGFLATDDSGWVNGQVIRVNGGLV